MSIDTREYVLISAKGTNKYMRFIYINRYKNPFYFLSVPLDLQVEA